MESRKTKDDFVFGVVSRDGVHGAVEAVMLICTVEQEFASITVVTADDHAVTMRVEDILNLVNRTMQKGN